MISFKVSRRSPQDYFLWRKEKAYEIVSSLSRFGPIKGKKILDLGCGWGALTLVLAEAGAKEVVGADVDRQAISKAKSFLRGGWPTVSFRAVSGGKLPFPDNSFDFVILWDVIEHTTYPHQTIKECIRILSAGGALFVEFTPYYSVIGHHLYDYTLLPIHFLPQKIVRQIVFSFPRPAGFRLPSEYWRNFLSLNKMRISDLQKWVRRLAVLEQRYLVKHPDYFALNLPFLSFVGPAKDFLTMSFQGIYRKGLVFPEPRYKPGRKTPAGEAE